MSEKYTLKYTGEEIENLLDEVDDKIEATEVLTKTNTTAFTPTEDYHPATKGYVDGLLANANQIITGTTSGYFDSDGGEKTISLKAGAKAVIISCEYNNPGSDPVYIGNSDSTMENTYILTSQQSSVYYYVFSNSANKANIRVRYYNNKLHYTGGTYGNGYRSLKYIAIY